jgi:hypothetical protein
MMSLSSFPLDVSFGRGALVRVHGMIPESTLQDEAMAVLAVGGQRFWVDPFQHPHLMHCFDRGGYVGQKQCRNIWHLTNAIRKVATMTGGEARAYLGGRR